MADENLLSRSRSAAASRPRVTPGNKANEPHSNFEQTLDIALKLFFCEIAVGALFLLVKLSFLNIANKFVQPRCWKADHGNKDVTLTMPTN